jgi:hypothetical protein
MDFRIQNPESRIQNSEARIRNPESGIRNLMERVVMKRDLRLGRGRLGIAATIVVGFAVLVSAQIAGSAEPCCFANGSYKGICKVIPGKGETCKSILAYLNNPMSGGKSYCRGTAIRGGWVRVDCKTGKSSIQQSAAGSAHKAGKPAPACEEAAGSLFELWKESPVLAARIVTERSRVSESARR